MAHRLEVRFKDEFVDARGNEVKRKINDYFGINVSSVHLLDVYTIDMSLEDEQLKRVQNDIFTDPITQTSSFEPLAKELGFDFIVEVGFLPGVKDNVGETSRGAIEDLLKIKTKNGETVYTSHQYLIKGQDLDKAKVDIIAAGLLANEMIEHWKIKSHEEWENAPFEIVIPKVDIPHKPTVRELDLNLNDEELEKLSKDRSLALSVADMHTIKKYFEKPEVIEARRKVGLSEKVTDVELEVIAQTQSEHCKHRIFNAKITYKENGNEEIIDSLFDTYIKKSSKEIEQKKNWIVSTFWDNAGVVKFNDNWNYIVKCETHNSPSALDPFGGAITGIVGVYRDPMGTGKGSKIIAGTYGFCTASPFYKGDLRPRMHPRRLLEGIVEGVRDGGNKSGIPTPYGIVFFDECFIGKPLVYVAALGIAPREVNGKPSHEKHIDDGDLIVMSGGRVGKDGIHGVTEASLEHGGWITGGHVQIGDPFTQKKMHDFLLEARDQELYKCITDNGGGGLSSSIGETSRLSNGCKLELDKIPLKYTGLDPWQILISESQERMSLGVDPAKFDELKKLAEKHDVEISVIGKYRSTGKFHVSYDGKAVAYLDMEFLHSGFPQYELEAEWNSKAEADELVQEKPDNIIGKPITNHEQILKQMLARINVASKEWIERQYDHEVQGGSALKYFIGAENDGFGDAAVIRPLLNSTEGLAISAGINPKYSKIDAYHMTACALDEAIRKVIAVGASMDQIALNDNFCWPNSVYNAETNKDGKHKLAQLVRANKALYEYTTHFQTPCISGKDSMFIDGNLKDKNGTSHKISGLPTLQFTAVGKVDDVEKCVSMDVKSPGDLIYVVGETKNELGASEYYEMLDYVGKNVPKLDKDKALATYQAVAEAIKQGLVRSCHGCYRGGLGVALAQKAFAGNYGLEVDLGKIPRRDVDDSSRALYSESAGRFVVSIVPENCDKFESIMNTSGVAYTCIGSVRDDDKFMIEGIDGKEIINVKLNELKEAWQKTFGGF